LAKNDTAKILSFVLGKDAQRDSGKRNAEYWIVSANFHREGAGGGCTAAEGTVLEDARGLPGFQALGDLLGVGFGVTGEFKGFNGKYGRGGMVAVRAARLRRETR
jgi:hypothetical protein